MRKFMLFLLFGSVGTGLWWQYGRTGDATAIVSHVELLQSLLRPDPARASIIGMPNGDRFISTIEKVKIYQDLTTAIGGLQTEVDDTNAVVTAIQLLQKETMQSCDIDVLGVLPELVTANENGEHLKSSLAEVDAWLQRTINFVQEMRPAGGNSVVGLFREFQRQRNEIEQSIKTIQSLSEAIPRLRKSICEPFEIPPFRAASD